MRTFIDILLDEKLLMFCSALVFALVIFASLLVEGKKGLDNMANFPVCRFCRKPILHNSKTVKIEITHKDHHSISYYHETCRGEVELDLNKRQVLYIEIDKHYE